jgi:hypothetical protein
MKRRTRTTPVKVYTYGCLAPTEGADELHEQMRLGTAYKHALVEIELWAREQYRAARREIDDSVLEAENAKAEAEQALKNAREDAKERKLSRAEKSDALAGLMAALKDAKESLAEARERARTDPELQTKAAEIAEEKNRRVKQARAASGLYWGSYLLREQAHDATMKACAREHVDPRHKPWNGNGRIGVQAQKPLTTSDVMAGKSDLLRIEVVPHRGQDPTSNCAKKRTFANVRIRIGSDVKRGPIWATLPVLLHRPIPNGRITWAWVKMTRIGLRSRYDLQLTVESSEFPEHAEGRSGEVELSVCWQIRQNGVCVGVLSDGTEYVVPQCIVDKIAHAQTAVRGPSDAAFDEARRGLMTWLEENEDDAPEWLRDWAKHAAKWNRHGKIRQIAERWASDMLGGESSVRGLWQQWVAERRHAQAKLYGTWTTVWPALEAFCDSRGVYDLEKRFALRLYWWRQQDGHLTQWEADEARGARMRRKDLYRVWARDAARRYSSLRLDAQDLGDAAEIQKGSIENEIRQAVAPSELRTAFEMAFGHRCERSGDAPTPRPARSAEDSIGYGARVA